MNDAQLLRYSRHLLLNEIDVAGQERLLQSHALIIGAGGLGSPAALYLASAGVGTLTIVDHDTVDATNLQRQIAHTEARVGSPKAISIRQAVAQINSEVCVQPIVQRADAVLLHELVAQADVVLDCTDNFATRHAVNQACVDLRTDLVWGAAIRFEGQLGVYKADDANSPCYACAFDPRHVPAEARCATMGVFAPLVGMVGSMQAAEAIKLLCGLPGSLHHAMLLIDAKSMHFVTLGMQGSPTCSVCATVRGRTPPV